LRKLKEFNFNDVSGVEEFRKKFYEFKLKFSYVFARQKFSEDSSGDFLDGAKHCHHCYIVVGGAEHCRYSNTIGLNGRDVIDSSNTTGELNCFVDGLLNSSRVIFSHFLRNCSEVSYSMFCYNCQNLFGCTGLVRKQYCIFNKQYTKEKYDEIVPKIVEHMQKTGEWGKYFPAKLSAFGYNETWGNDMVPLSKEEALDKGFKWSDYKQEVEVSGGGYIICEVSGRLFRPVKQEVEFYKKQGIPSPRLHPDVRIARRYAMRNPFRFWERKCMKCDKDIVTTYDPKRPEIVYCEECYLKEVY